MFKRRLFLIFLFIGGFAKAQIPLAEVKVNPTYTAWEVLEKAKKVLLKDFDAKSTRNYKLFSQTIKDKKDTLLLFNQEVKYNIYRCSRNFCRLIRPIKAQIKDSLFFNRFENSSKFLQLSFFYRNLHDFLPKANERFIPNYVKYQLNLERIENNYKISYSEKDEDGYWIVDAKDFTLKEIYRQRINQKEYRNQINDTKEAVPNKVIKENVISSNYKSQIIFAKNIKNKIIIQSTRKEYGALNYNLKVFLDNQFKEEITFEYNAIFKMDLIK
jgi:hypothetical protein